MSDPVKGLQLEEASMRLLSRLGDARFELTNGTRERAYAEVVAAEVDASEVTEALAKTRVELAELRAAVREWVARMDEAHPGWHERGPVTNLLEAGDNLRRLAEETP